MRDIVDAAFLAAVVSLGVALGLYDRASERAREMLAEADRRLFLDDDGWCVA